MRLCSSNEFAKLSANSGVELTDGKVFVETDGALKIHWEDNVNYVAFAKAAEKTVVSSQYFIIFYEYGIWPSSENLYLFKLVMQAWFSGATIRPNMCTHFGSNDKEAAITLLQIGLQSGWGGIFFGDKQNWFQFNHDGLGYVKSSAAAFDELEGLRGITICA